MKAHNENNPRSETKLENLSNERKAVFFKSIGDNLMRAEKWYTQLDQPAYLKVIESSVISEAGKRGIDLPDNEVANVSGIILTGLRKIKDIKGLKEAPIIPESREVEVDEGFSMTDLETSLKLAEDEAEVVNKYAKRLDKKTAALVAGNHDSLDLEDTKAERDPALVKENPLDYMKPERLAHIKFMVGDFDFSDPGILEASKILDPNSYGGIFDPSGFENSFELFKGILSLYLDKNITIARLIYNQIPKVSRVSKNEKFDISINREIVLNTIAQHFVEVILRGKYLSYFLSQNNLTNKQRLFATLSYLVASYLVDSPEYKRSVTKYAQSVRLENYGIGKSELDELSRFSGAHRLSSTHSMFKKVVHGESSNRYTGAPRTNFVMLNAARKITNSNSYLNGYSPTFDREFINREYKNHDLMLARMVDDVVSNTNMNFYISQKLPSAIAVQTHDKANELIATFMEMFFVCDVRDADVL